MPSATSRVADGAADFSSYAEPHPDPHFLCVLAYHLLAAIEHRFLQPACTPPGNPFAITPTHQVITIVLPKILMAAY